MVSQFNSHLLGIPLPEGSKLINLCRKEFPCSVRTKAKRRELLPKPSSWDILHDLRRFPGSAFAAGWGHDSTYLAVGNETEDSLLERRPSLPI